jgi:3-methyladenine DNA glycosylase AlkD
VLPTADEIQASVAALPRLDAASLRRVRREYTLLLKRAPGARVLAIALELMKKHGNRFVACELVCYHPEALARVGPTQLRKLGAGFDGWASVDIFATLVGGRAWRQRQVDDALIHRWARSRDRWWRRAALVCTVPLNVRAQGGEGDAGRTLQVCELVVDDRDDMVVKAFSWALRELAVRDPEAVRAFVDERRDELAARVVREVTHKLETGLKNPGRGAATRRSSPRRPAARRR